MEYLSLINNHFSGENQRVENGEFYAAKKIVILSGKVGGEKGRKQKQTAKIS